MSNVEETYWRNQLPVRYSDSLSKRILSSTIFFDLRERSSLSWNDSDNILKLYSINNPSEPFFSVPLSDVNKVLSEGNRIKIWIRNKKYTLPLGHDPYDSPFVLNKIAEFAHEKRKYSAQVASLLKFLNKSPTLKHIKIHPIRAVFVGIGISLLLIAVIILAMFIAFE